MFRWMRFSLITVLVLCSASIALACGGLFLTPEEQKIADIAQHGERIIFTVNGNNSYTAILGIDYVGSAREFSWIMPVPSVPEVDVVDQKLMDDLQTATNMQFTEPVDPCNQVHPVIGFGGGGDYIERGKTGPYEFAIIKNDSPDEMVAWLNDNGYVVTDAGKAMIEAYVKEGAYFLAMKLRQDAEVGDIQPVRLKYTSDKLQMAMRMTSIAAVPQMPLYVWIFADTQYAPENFAHPTVDYTAFTITSSLNNYSSGYLHAENQYQKQLDAFQAQYEGKSFVTEYAGPTSALALADDADALLKDYAKQYPYITRLHGQMSPEQMTLDPIFAPDATTADVSPNIDLGDYHDPLHYYGCSTRELAVDTTSIPQKFDLPSRPLQYYTGPSEIPMQVAVPDGWKMNKFKTGDLDIQDTQDTFVFSPETVTADTIRAYADGQPTPPMFIIVPQPLEGVYDFGAPDFLQTFGDSPFGEGWYDMPPGRYGFASVLPGYNTFFGWGYILLTSQADWDANKDTYQAMIGYILSYPYYLSKDLRYTLFLGQNTSLYDGAVGTVAAERIPFMYIGFPEGWTEHMVDIQTGETLITPDNAGDDSPRARLLRSSTFNGTNPGTFDAFDSPGVQDAVRAAYGLAPDVDLTPFENCGANDGSLIIAPYKVDGRQGYVSIFGDFLAEVSAPEAQFAENDATLHAMIESIPVARSLCG